jgi:capsular polysaccharide transport system ATP-binding protein
MIRLENLSQSYFNDKPVFPEITLELPTDRRLGLLGAADSGKTTLLNLLAGLTEPHRGRIERFARLSFPAGYQRGFRFSQSAKQNAIFAARIYDADPQEVLHFVCTLTDLGDQLERPMRDLSVPARLIFAYVLTYALPFDTYLFDNIIGPGVPGTRELWEQLYAARTREAGAIIATRQPRVVEALCDCVLVLGPGGAAYYDDIKDGIEAYAEARAAAQAAPAPDQPGSGAASPLLRVDD